MQSVELVPEEFRDKQHLELVQRRIFGVAIVIAVIFLAATAICLLDAKASSGLTVRVGIPAAAGLSLFAVISLMKMRRRLSVMEPTDIMTFIEACDCDMSGRASTEVSGLVAELYASQGFLTQAQFTRMTSLLHGRGVPAATIPGASHLPFDEHHELA